MSPVRLAAVCIPVAAGLLAVTLWPARTPDPEYRPEVEAPMRAVYQARQQSAAVGLLGGAAVPVCSDTGEPSWAVTAPRPSAQAGH